MGSTSVLVSVEEEVAGGAAGGGGVEFSFPQEKRVPVINAEAMSVLSFICLIS
jgi:hypothetical protein